MTESEFTQISDALFARIERGADEAGIDATLNGNVLELEFDDSQKIIVNRHTPTQEMWLAAKSGGFHFRLQGGSWISQREDAELFEKLGEVAGALLGESVQF